MHFVRIVIIFLLSTVIKFFIDVFKYNKYKQHIIQCVLLLDLYIKLLKQVAKHLITFPMLSQNILN